MKDNEASMLLTQRADQVQVGGAPTGQLIAQGRRVRNRRRGAGVLGGAAAVALIAAGATFLPGLGGSDDTAPVAGETNDVSQADISGAWELNDVHGTDEVGGTDGAELQLQDGKVTTTDGCNAVIGTYTLGADGAFNVKLEQTTMLGCTDDTKTDVAEQLKLAQTIAIDGDQLVLRNVEGMKIMSFGKTTAPEPPTNGGPKFDSWKG